MQKALKFYFGSEIFLSTGIGMVQYAQPFYYASAHLNDQQIGILFSINAFVGGLCALVLGPLADRVGASKVFKLSTALLGTSYLLMSFTHIFIYWCYTAGLSGIAGAMLLSTENVVLSSLTQGREKAGVLSKFVALYTFIIGFGVVLSGLVVAKDGVHAAMLMGACIALVAPTIRLFVKAPDARSHRALRKPSRRIIWMSLYTLLFGMATGLISPFITLVLHTQFGLSTHLTSVVFALSMFTISLGSFIVAYLIRKLKHAATLLLSFGLSILSTFVLAFVHGSWTFVVIYLFRSVVTTVPGSIVDAMFLNLTHVTDYAQMFGVRVFGSNVGSAIGQFLGGTLLALHGLKILLILSAMIFAISYVYLLGLMRAVRRSDDGIMQTHVSIEEGGTVIDG